jgi:anti-sigma-K factor RskA
MNYDDPRLRALLAGEYVLGTLRGRARRRFERLLLDEPALRRLVEDWEMKLNLLAESIPPVKPPERVWRAIQARIAPARTEAPGWWNRLALWRALAAAALLAGVVLGIQLARPPALETPPARVAVLTGTQGQPAWLLALVAKPGEGASLRFTALQPQVLGPDQSLELWLIPGGEGAPVSAGLLPPSGSGTQPLPAAAWHALGRAQAVAVSLEPKGGSPTGAPTGPVLFQGVLMTL